MSFRSAKPIILAALVVFGGMALLQDGNQQAEAGPFRQFMPLNFSGDSNCKNGNCPNGKCPLIPNVVPNAIKKATKPIADTVSPGCKNCKDCKCGDNCKCTNGECNDKGKSQVKQSAPAPAWKSVVTHRGNGNSCQPRYHNNCQQRRLFFRSRCR